MKNNRNMAWIAVLSALLLLLLAGCGGSKKGSGPEDTVKALESAINDLDPDGIVSCLNEELGGYANTLLELPIGDRGASVRSVLRFIHLPELTGESVRLALEVQSLDMSDSTAAAQTLARVTCGSYTKDVNLTIDMELQDGRWVISGLR